MKEVPNFPDVLTKDGFSLDTHIFRYRPDREFTDGNGEKKNFMLEEVSKFTLWHSAIDALNDPFEIYAHRNVDELKEMTQEEKFKLWRRIRQKNLPAGHRVVSNESLKERYLQDERRGFFPKVVQSQISGGSHFDEYLHSVRTNLGIASFTEVCNSRLMWGYYCNGLTGFCLIYNKNKLLHKKIILEKVSYISGAYQINLVDYVYGYRTSGSYDSHSEMVRTKHIEWEHERELRSVVNLLPNEAGKGGAIQLSDSCVDAIILGKRAREEVKFQARKLAKKIRAKVYMADVDFEEFGVRIYK